MERNNTNISQMRKIEINPIVAQYLKSLMNDVYDIDFFCGEREAQKKICRFVLTECIEVLEDIKHPEGNHNTIVQNKIDFLTDCIKKI